MRKILVFSTFILSIIAVFLNAVYSIIENHKKLIDQLAPSTPELKEEAAKMGHIRLSDNEVTEICTQLNHELVLLDKLKWGCILSIFFIVLLISIGLLKLNFKIKRFTGLSILVITPIIYSLNCLVYEFSGIFYSGHNATLIMRVGTLFATIVVPPFLFYTAFKMNKIEVELQLHKQKWISYTSFVLAIVSLIVAIIIGLGVLMTPDLSGNIN